MMKEKNLGKQLKILLVEDHLGHRLKLIQTLKDYGAEIDSAVTFQRARELSSKRSYDLVISELLLSHCPELQGDGVQFWRYFQKIHPKTPLVLIAEDSLRTATEMVTQESERPAIFSKPVSPSLAERILEHGIPHFRRGSRLIA